MPTVITQGAASAKGYGFGASSTAANYIEDVFSTYLYTGTGASQTISNGVDLSTKGGMVWIKSRSAATNNFLFDTSRGTTKEINSNTTDAEATLANSLTAFNTDGFTVNSATGIGVNAATYASWTFRKQAKFFDVVTWTGDGGTSGRTITHNLGSAPGCIIVKNITSAEDWYVYPASLGNTGTKQYFLILNSTAAQDTGGFGIEKSSNWTSTQFSLVAGTSALNGSGQTYVAYLFAHDAGGFGASGSDNVITCGTFTANASSYVNVNLGYEPQFVLTKCTSTTDNWTIYDDMRGMPASTTTTSTGNTTSRLKPNVSNAEDTGTTQIVNVTNTGFAYHAGGYGSQTFIYIAIRRGPMKTPTSGTSVFVPVAGTGAYGGVTMTTNFPADTVLDNKRNGAGEHWFFDRLRSAYGTKFLSTSSTAAESSSGTSYMIMDSNTTVINNDWGGDISNTFVSYVFRRAPGFFDVVCYTGTGGNTTVNHNLGVAPELLIIKGRSLGGYNWITYWASSPPAFNGLTLNTNQGPFDLSSAFNNTYPTSSTFSLANVASINNSGSTYVAYLFATCPGVSKVGTYTGTAALQTINCGFTSGARFVLIKRTDSTGDWYVWDSARGIVSGNDPYLLLNSTAAEVTNTDYIDTYSAGFEISSTAPAAINANGGSFIFLAIA